MMIEHDVGLGTAYERVAVYRLFDRWLVPRDIRTALEGPVDGMAGIPGLHLVGLARHGTRVTVVLPDEPALAVVRGVYRHLGVEDRLETLRLAADAPLPERAYDLVLTYNALPLVADWRGYVARLARSASRYLLVSVTNPGSYGVAIRKTQRLLEPCGEPELFDHAGIRPATLGPFVERFGRVEEHGYFDCPWWPDLFVPTGWTLWEGLVGRLPGGRRLVGRWRTAAKPARGAVPFLYGPERFPLFPGVPGCEEMEAALRRHPVFDDRGDLLGRAFGHHHAYLVGVGTCR